LPEIYSLPSADFHDITGGNNGGYISRPGYDLTTGRGSPVANLLVPDLATMGLATQPPVVAKLTASASPISQGATLVLTATGVGDVGGHVQDVSFYRESNGKPGLQLGAGGDMLLGVDTNGADGWSIAYSTTGLATGSYTFYAVATVTGGLSSAVGVSASSVKIDVAKPAPVITPVIASLTASTSVVATPATPLVLCAHGVAESGTTTATIAYVDFYLEFNGQRGLQTDSATGDFLDFTADKGFGGAWTDVVSVPTDLDPQSGVYTFYAVAFDTLGRQSAPVAVQITYNGGTDPAPKISTLRASATKVLPGAQITLTSSNFSDPDGNLGFVSYYLESNGQTGLQVGPGGDTLVATDSSGISPSTVQFNAPAAAGTYIYYAQMTDSNGVSSATGLSAVKITLTVV